MLAIPLWYMAGLVAFGEPGKLLYSKMFVKASCLRFVTFQIQFLFENVIIIEVLRGDHGQNGVFWMRRMGAQELVSPKSWIVRF